MPYEPTFPQPYLKSIDASISTGNDFQCTINARDKIIAYKIIISSVSEGSEVCYIRGEIVDDIQKKYSKISSGEETEVSSIPSQDSTLPFQGRADSDKSIFVVNVPYGLNLENGEEYLWTIELTDSSSTSISRDYFFTTAKSPDLSFTIPETVESNRISVVANYSQEQNLIPAYYRFDLYTDGELIYTTHDVFSSDIAFEYDKLINKKAYTLDLHVFLDDGTESSYISHFDVLYEEPENIISPKITADQHKTFVNIDFSQQANIDGYIDGEDKETLFLRARNAGGEYPDSENILRLKNGQCLYWNTINNNPLDLENTVQILHWHPHKPFRGKIFEKIDMEYGLRNISILFDEGCFSYNIGTHNTVYKPIYAGKAIAIAGEDEYALMGEVISVIDMGDTMEIELQLTKQSGVEIVVGMVATFDNQDYEILWVDGNIITVQKGDSAYSPEVEDFCSIHYKEYLYTLSDSSLIEDTAVLVDNDLTPDKWWYIYVSSNDVEFVEDENIIEIEEVS